MYSPAVLRCGSFLHVLVDTAIDIKMGLPESGVEKWDTWGFYYECTRSTPHII